MSRKRESSSNWFKHYIQEHLGREKALLNDHDYNMFARHLERDNPCLFKVLVGLYVKSVGPEEFKDGIRKVVYREKKKI